jgi:hypothetical protein
MIRLYLDAGLLEEKKIKSTQMFCGDFDTAYFSSKSLFTKDWIIKSYQHPLSFLRFEQVT